MVAWFLSKFCYFHFLLFYLNLVKQCIQDLCLLTDPSLFASSCNASYINNAVVHYCTRKTNATIISSMRVSSSDLLQSMKLLQICYSILHEGLLIGSCIPLSFYRYTDPAAMASQKWLGKSGNAILVLSCMVANLLY